MTFLTNKEGHGKRHTLIAAVKGTKTTARIVAGWCWDWSSKADEMVTSRKRFR